MPFSYPLSPWEKAASPQATRRGEVRVLLIPRSLDAIFTDTAPIGEERDSVERGDAFSTPITPDSKNKKPGANVAPGEEP